MFTLATVYNFFLLFYCWRKNIIRQCLYRQPHTVPVVKSMYCAFYIAVLCDLRQQLYVLKSTRFVLQKLYKQEFFFLLFHHRQLCQLLLTHTCTSGVILTQSCVVNDHLVHVNQELNVYFCTIRLKKIKIVPALRYNKQTNTQTDRHMQSLIL